MTKLVLYKQQNGKTELKIPLSADTVWLSLNQMADLFGRSKSVISRHIKAIYDTNELEIISTVAKYATVQTEGNRKTERIIDHYDLDVIISVGYRVNSKEGIQFRKWANDILKKHCFTRTAFTTTN